MAAAELAGGGIFKGLEFVGPRPPRALSMAVTEKFTGIREDLGDYIYLTPTKLGGASTSRRSEVDEAIGVDCLLERRRLVSHLASSGGISGR